MPEDHELLRDYACHYSESAFTELVRRHVDLVYSAALRETHGDGAMAEDVTQGVFAELAGKASRLCRHPALAGWLYTCVRHKSANARRSDDRRQRREQEAHTMSELLTPDSTESSWQQVQPVLDDAMHELSETDRAAVVLRFFEDRTHKEVGLALGLDESAARKRVDRALERLRELLAKRGVTSGASGIAAVLYANAVQAAPVGLAVTISTAAAIAGTTITTAATATATKAIAMTTLQKTIIGATIAAAVGTGIYEARQASTLRTQLQMIRQQQAPLAGQIEQLRGQRDEAARELEMAQQEIERLRRDTAELAKLRGEVARLRSDAQELAQLKAGSSNDATESAAKSWVTRVSQLRQRLEQWPDKRIPELQLVTEQDWLSAARGDLDTDDDYRRALSTLRNAGENKFASTLLQPALKEYMRANNGQFPTDLSQLQPHFKSPVDNAILERWEIMPAEKIKSLGLGGDVIISQKAAVDDVYDTRFAVGPSGRGSTDFLSREIADTMNPVWEAYRASHDGQWPEDPSQLLHYATTSAQQTAVQKLILQKAAGK